MKFVATVDKKHRSAMDEIVQALKNMGVSISGVLKITGVIYGNSRNKPLHELKIEGISSVQKEGAVRISDQ